jgi:hypothetical protein
VAQPSHGKSHSCLDTIKGAKSATQWYLRLILSQFNRLVAADIKELRPGPDPSMFPWELEICVTIFGLLALMLFLWFHAIRQKKFATKHSELMEEKCELFQKVSLFQKELEVLESSLKDASSGKVSTVEKNLRQHVQSWGGPNLNLGVKHSSLKENYNSINLSILNNN